jgi:ribosomal protein L24E
MAFNISPGNGAFPGESQNLLRFCSEKEIKILAQNN